MNRLDKDYQQLIAKMDQLMTMMVDGGIAVNLDGQLVSKQLATTAYRSGGFGQFLAPMAL